VKLVVVVGVEYSFRNCKAVPMGKNPGVNQLKFEQVELQAKLLNYFLGINESNINQFKDSRTNPRVRHLGFYRIRVS